MFLESEISRDLEIWRAARREIWEICLKAAECPGAKCREAKGMKAVKRQAAEHLATGNKEEGNDSVTEGFQNI